MATVSPSLVASVKAIRLAATSERRSTWFPGTTWSVLVLKSHQWMVEAPRTSLVYDATSQATCGLVWLPGPLFTTENEPTSVGGVSCARADAEPKSTATAASRVVMGGL